MRMKISFNIYIVISIILMLIAIFFGFKHFDEKNKIINSYKNDEYLQDQITNISDVDEDVINWLELKELAPDAIAWISIPNTNINYPILQTTDNSFYLNYNYKKEPDSLGSIFMDYRQPSDFSDYNTIIYGHNVSLSNPSPKFGELMNYYNTDYFNEHKNVLIYTPEKTWHGEVIAVHADSADSKSQNINIESKDELIEYINFMKDNSEVNSDYKVEDANKIITLWSCAMKSTINTNGDFIDNNTSRTFLTIVIN